MYASIIFFIVSIKYGNLIILVLLKLIYFIKQLDKKLIYINKIFYIHLIYVAK